MQKNLMAKRPLPMFSVTTGSEKGYASELVSHTEHIVTIQIWPVSLRFSARFLLHWIMVASATDESVAASLMS
jgi:hypothetical protein